MRGRHHSASSQKEPGPHTRTLGSIFPAVSFVTLEVRSCRFLPAGGVFSQKCINFVLKVYQVANAISLKTTVRRLTCRRHSYFLHILWVSMWPHSLLVSWTTQEIPHPCQQALQRERIKCQAHKSPMQIQRSLLWPLKASKIDAGLGFSLRGHPPATSRPHGLTTL